MTLEKKSKGLWTFPYLSSTLLRAPNEECPRVLFRSNPMGALRKKESMLYFSCPWQLKQGLNRLLNSQKVKDNQTVKLFHEFI